MQVATVAAVSVSALWIAATILVVGLGSSVENPRRTATACFP
jgi:hypothetical protein